VSHHHCSDADCASCTFGGVLVAFLLFVCLPVFLFWSKCTKAGQEYTAEQARIEQACIDKGGKWVVSGRSGPRVCVKEVR
jgi:hypothetical protein